MSLGRDEPPPAGALPHHRLTAEALAEMRRLFRRWLEALWAHNIDQAQELERELDGLLVDAKNAGYISGGVSPWKPTLGVQVEGIDTPSRLDFAAMSDRELAQRVFGVVVRARGEVTVSDVARQVGLTVDESLLVLGSLEEEGLVVVRRMPDGTGLTVRTTGVPGPPRGGSRDVLREIESVKVVPDRVPQSTTRPPMLDPQFRWPQLDRSIQYLRDRQIYTPEEADALTARNKRSGFTAPGKTAGALQRIKARLTDALRSGESLQNFLRSPTISGSRNELETLFRTEIKTAYTEGQERTLTTPHLASAFPYVLYAATADNRVRDHHWDLDGIIVARGSAAHRVLRRATAEWNCRCTLIPLSESQAEGKKVYEYSDLPGSVLAKLG